MADSIAQVILRVRDEGSGALAGVAARAGETRDQVQRTSVAMDDLGDASGRAGQNAAKLAGGLGLVSPEAASGALAIADLADVAEVLTTALGAAGVSAASVATVLAPLAIAAGAVAAAYYVLNQRLEEAEARQKAAADAAERAAKVYGDLRTRVNELDTAYRVQTGLMSAAAAEAERLRQGVEEMYGPALAEQQSVIDGLNAEIAARRANYDELVKEEGGKDAVGARTQGLVEQLEKETEQYNALIERKNEDLQKSDEIVAAKVREEQARARAAAAREREAELARQAAEAARALEDAQREENARTQEKIALTAQLEAIVLASASAEEKARAAYRARQDVISQAIDADVDSTRVLDAKTASLQQLTDDLRAAAEAQRDLTEAVAESSRLTAGQVASGVGDIAGSLAGGLGGVPAALQSGAELAELAGMAGTAAGLAAAVPIAGAIIQIVDLVNAIVPAEGENGLLDVIRETLLSFADNLTRFVDEVVEFVVAILTQLPPALIAAMPAIVRSAIGAIDDLLFAAIEAVLLSIKAVIVDLIIGIPKGIAEGFGQLITGLVQYFTGGGEDQPGALEQGGFFDQLFRGSFDVGTSGVTRTGLALVHQDERIIRATGGASGRTALLARESGGSSLTVNVSGYLLAGPTQLGQVLDRGLGDESRRGAWAA